MTEVEHNSIEVQIENTKKCDIKGAKTEEERAEIGKACVAQIEEWKKHINGLTDRWKENERLYRNEASVAPVQGDGFSNHSMPLYQSKADALAASVCGAITGAEPYYVAKSFGQRPEGVNELEMGMHHLMEVAGFERKAREAAIPTFNTGQAFIKCNFVRLASGFVADTPDVDIMQGREPETLVDPNDPSAYSYVGFEFVVVHPQDFVFGPSSSDTIEKCSIYGERKYLTRSQVRARQDAGEWFRESEPLSTGKPKSENQGGRDKDHDLTQESGVHMDESIEIFDVNRKLKLDGKYCWYNVVIDSAGFVFSITKYPCVQANYAQAFLTIEHGSLLRSNGLGQNVQGPAKIYNDLFNLLMDGSLVAAFPPTGYRSGSLANADTKFRPGDMIEFVGNPEFVNIPTQFNPTVIPMLIQMVGADASAAIRVDANMTGASFAGDISAREAGQISGNTMSGMKEYVAYFSLGWIRILNYMREVAHENFDLLKAFWGDQFPIEDKEVLKIACRWEANGKTLANTPRGTAQAVEMLINVAGQAAQLEAQGASVLKTDELVRTVARASQLPNAERLITPAAELQQAREAQQQQQQQVMQMQMELEQAKMNVPIQTTQMRVEADLQKKQISEDNKDEHEQLKGALAVARIGLDKHKAETDAAIALHGIDVGKGRNKD